MQVDLADDGAQVAHLEKVEHIQKWDTEDRLIAGHLGLAVLQCSFKSYLQAIYSL